MKAKVLRVMELPFLCALFLWHIIALDWTAL